MLFLSLKADFDCRLKFVFFLIAMDEKMNHLDISQKFDEFASAFYEIEDCKFNLENSEVSESIFFQIFKIKQSLWRQSVNFNRRIRISMSEIFQDLIALYLKLSLGDGFEIILEEKKEKLRPDILIKYKGKNIFIIEVKTTIGWERKAIRSVFPERIKKLAEVFDVPEKNVIYILQSPWNVNNDFTSKYLDLKTHKFKSLPLEMPFNQIRPLLTGEDPYYCKETDVNKPTKFSDDEIKEMAKNRIVVPIESTIKQILAFAVLN